MRIKEFEDCTWFPDVIRRGMTDYLRFVFHTGRLYEPAVDFIVEGMKKSGASRVIDLCSGGGGTIELVSSQMNQRLIVNTPVVLTDRFPNTEAYRLLQQRTKGVIGFHPTAVNATSVPHDLTGFRTIFSGIHHFHDAGVKEVLKNAIKGGQGIGVFDGGDKHVLFVALITLLHPLFFFACTPFIRPFCFSRLFFTYVIPLIPLCTMWDGALSVLKLYQPEKLLSLAQEADVDKQFVWKAGKVRNKLGLRLTYLVGYPKEQR